MQYSKMEKSMVQELSVLTHSTVFSSRPSFLNDCERPELRRSRIQNLPGYRREDLSTKLNFVVVFQTIEIERLSAEVEGLRVMVRDADRQRLNFENYEVQIRELTERCHALQLHRDDLEDELTRMRGFTARLVAQLEHHANDDGLREKHQAERARADQLQSEVERWRGRYAAVEAARAKELEQVRGEFEARRRSQISRETRELAIRHDNELAALANDLRKAREEAQLRTAEASRLAELVTKYQLREQELHEVEEKMEEYENRFVLLSQENYRLNELLRKRTDDLDRARRDVQDSRTRADSFLALQEQLARAQGAAEEREGRVAALEREVRAAGEERERLGLEGRRGQEYERLADELEQEVQRLNALLRDKVNEGEQLRTQQRILESKLTAATAATQKEFAAYEERIVAYTRDQERLNAQLKHRLAENEQLRHQTADLDALTTENDSLRRQLGQYDTRIDELKRKIQKHEDNLLLMEQIEHKLHAEENAKQQLLADRDRLNAALREAALRAETATQAAAAAQEAAGLAAGVEGELRECRQRLGWMGGELDRISSELEARVAELQQLREGYRVVTSSKTTYQAIEQRLLQNLAQMEQLVLDLDAARRENDRLHSDNMDQQVAIRGLQGQILSLHEERDDRTRLFEAQNADMEHLRQKVDYLSAEAKGKQQAEQALQEHQKKLETQKSLYAQLEERLRKETAHSETMVYELMQIRSQPRVSRELADELQTVRRQAEEQRVALGTLLQRLEGMKGLLVVVRQQYTQQLQELAALRQRVETVETRAGCIDDLQALLGSYCDQVDGLREENFRLESEKALAGVEYCESYKVIQEEAVAAPQPSIKNSSIAYKVSAQDLREEDNKYLFTFKEVQRSKPAQDTLITRQEYITRQEEYTAGKQEYGRQDQINEHLEQDQEGSAEGSMASSFINTLITKDSTARFERTQEAEGGFGYNFNSKLRYLTPYARQEQQPERQIENVPAQINRAVSPTHQRAAQFDTAGIKRVVSYTHFGPTAFQAPLSPHSHAYQPWQHSPTAARAPGSPTEASWQPGQRIRIPADPARLLLYRQQH